MKQIKNELNMFAEFLENKKQETQDAVSMLTHNLLINEVKLSQAIGERNFANMAELKQQRDNLKSMLIDELFTQLKEIKNKVA